MSVGGGSDRSWLKPRQSSEALNVRNPQPGFHYYYCRRDPSSVQRKLNQKWQVVTSDMPEKWGAELPDNIQQELDGVRAFKDVMLLRIKDEDYRLIQEEKQRRAAVARDGATEEYLEKGRQRAAQLGNLAPEDDLYYKKGYHGSQ
jgi:hypothetical protein